jgi:hypothetical protein
MIIAHVSGSLAFIGHLDGYFQKVSNICAACVFLTRDKKEFLELCWVASLTMNKHDNPFNICAA